MRLHLNENTAGCSPAVLEVLRGLSRSDAGFYPDYDKAQEAVGRLFGTFCSLIESAFSAYT